VTAAPGGDVAGPAGAATVPVAPLEAGARVAIVASRYHGDIVQRLVDGAFAELGERGVEERRVTLALVPGAFELPVVAKTLACRSRSG
jgi:6,7-dimethyl-8-ribityllumazine synthase